MHKFARLALASALAFAVVPSQVLAGPMPPVIEDPVCAVPFTGSVAAGYETTYLFRGVDFGDDAPWASIDVSFDTWGATSIDLGTWYINPTGDVPGNDAEFDELDVYAFLNFPLWIFDASIGAVWFYFAETDDEALEGDFSLAYSVGDLFDLGLLTVFDETTDGWYFELSASKGIPLTDCLSLGLGAGISYGLEYYGVEGWNHAFATAGLTYALTETAAVDLYIGGNMVFDELESAGEDDDVHGGISVSVGF